jgi:predicted DNA-binding transcriptional regulator YafY
MSEASNAMRLMEIREILLSQTDEDHPLTLIQIIQQLQLRHGSEYTAQKNTIKKMIEDLRESGFPIEEHIGNRKTVYYNHTFREFEVHELRMLIDAVSSARFITIKETKELIDKIKTLTSNHLAKKLQHQISVAPEIKALNQEVRYHIDKIHTSINERKRLTFQYGNYNVKKEFVLRHHGKIYTVIPLGLVWNSDYYYLVAKDEDAAEVKHYRVDRVKEVSVSEVPFTLSNFNIAEHMKQTFNMYPGDVQFIEIQFDNHLINVVIDRFGKDILIHQVGDQTFTVKIKAAMSEGLIRWLLTWGSDAKALSPQTLVDRMKLEVTKMAELYS